MLELKESGQKPNLALPDPMPSDDVVKQLAKSVLQKDKGSGYAGRLIELCQADELPPSVTGFLDIVYAHFKGPEPIPPIDPVDTDEVAMEAAGAAEEAPVVASQPEAG